MNFNFNLKQTAIFQAYKRSKNFLFKYADLISQGFLAVLILSLFFVFISFVNDSSQIVSIKASALLLLFAVIFWYIGLFSEYKIKRVRNSPSLQDAIADIANYNIADFLDLQMAGAVSDALKFCKRKKMLINSSSLLYSMAKLCSEANIVLFRLGIDRKTFLEDLKNYLEKIPKAGTPGEFSEDFVVAITDAAMVAAKRNKEKIGSKEVLISWQRQMNFSSKFWSTTT
jgi:uncharacterized membrane protein